MFIWIGAVLLVIVLWRWAVVRKRQQRLQYLKDYRFDTRYFKQLRLDYPALSEADQELVVQALRQFFLVRWQAPKADVYMPSVLVDALWHAFILDTQRYQQFCQKAFGQFFHHVPSYTTQGKGVGYRRTLLQATWNACKQTRGLLPGAMLGGVPLLFALDAHAGLDGGYRYSGRDLAYWERQLRASGASSSCSGGGSGCSSSSSSSTDSSGCSSSSSDSSGCSGGGCGGGGGGD